MLYILGGLCFVAIAVAAVMLIMSIHMRRIDTRFWSIFLCCSLVCSLAFYGVNRSVSNKKEPPVIDFSGIVPQVKEEPSEDEPVQEETSEEVPETEETQDETTENTGETGSEQSDDYSETDAGFDSASGGDSHESDADNSVSGETEGTEAPEQTPPAESESELPPEYEAPPAPPEIEYEGPFRTE